MAVLLLGTVSLIKKGTSKHVTKIPDGLRLYKKNNALCETVHLLRNVHIIVRDKFHQKDAEKYEYIKHF